MTNVRAPRPQILVHNVSGVLKRGMMTAIIGGAENGTQALLEVLAGVQRGGDVSGTILIDGASKGRAFRRQVGTCA